MLAGLCIGMVDPLSCYIVRSPDAISAAATIPMSSQDSDDNSRFFQTEQVDPLQALVEVVSSIQLSGNDSTSAAVRASTIPLPSHGSGACASIHQGENVDSLTETTSGIRLFEEVSTNAAPRSQWTLDLGVLFSADSMRELFGRDPSSECFFLPPAPAQPHPPLQAADVLRGACNICTQYLHCTLLRVSSSKHTKPQLVTAITEFCSVYSKTEQAVDAEVAQFVLTHLEHSGRVDGDMFVANVLAPKQVSSFTQSLCRHLFYQGYESMLSSPHVTFAKKKYEQQPYTNWRSWLPHLSSKPVFMQRSCVLQATQVFERLP